MLSFESAEPAGRGNGRNVMLKVLLRRFRLSGVVDLNPREKLRLIVACPSACLNSDNSFPSMGLSTTFLSSPPALPGDFYENPDQLQQETTWPETWSASRDLFMCKNDHVHSSPQALTIFLVAEVPRRRRKLNLRLRPNLSVPSEQIAQGVINDIQEPSYHHPEQISSAESPANRLQCNIKNRRTLAFVNLNLRTLGTGPVSHSLLLIPMESRCNPLDLPVCLAFDAYAMDIRKVSLLISDASVSIPSCSVDTVYLAVAFAPSLCPEIYTSSSPLPSTVASVTTASPVSLSSVALPDSNDLSASTSSQDASHPFRSSAPRPRAIPLSVGFPCDLDIRGTSLPARLGMPNRVQVFSPYRKADPLNVTWRELPAISIPSCSLACLAHGSLSIQLFDAQNKKELVAECCIPFHDLWAAVIEPQGLHRLTVEMSFRNRSAAVISATLQVWNAPIFSQMLGGVRTVEGITGARPLIFGVPLPADIPHISSGVVDLQGEIFSNRDSNLQRLPYGWIELIDSFGYIYWHNMQAEHKGGIYANSWVQPDAQGGICDMDEDLVKGFAVDRVSHACFRSRADGADSWIHPRALRISRTCNGLGLAETRSQTGEILQHCSPMPRAQVNITIPAQKPNESTERNSDLCCTSLDQEGAPSNFVSETIPAESDRGFRTSSPILNLRSGNRQASSVTNVLADETGCATEMRWSRLAPMSIDPLSVCIPTEGHSLTRHGGNMILKFGGANNKNLKLNNVYSFDIDAMVWSRRTGLGQLPIGRVGHGAAAIGANLSRLLIFGGTSRNGRLNDVHTFNVESNVWSPVTCSGMYPTPRARHGMAALGDSTFIFGGREGYHYLYANYFNDLHCLNSTRSEWIKIAPRGNVPPVRSGCAMQVLSDRLLFVHGGYDEKNYFSDTWIFDIVSESWQRLPYVDETLQPSPRESHASARIGNGVLICTGESESGGYLPDSYLFDVDRLRWIGVPTISGHSPGARSGAAMVNMDNSKLLFTGGTNGFSASSDSFVLDTCNARIADVARMTRAARLRAPDSESCVICLDETREVDSLFVYCGHIVACNDCAKSLYTSCPVCRSPIAKVVDLSKVSEISKTLGFLSLPGDTTK